MLEPLDSKNLPYFKALSKKRKIAFLVLSVEKIILLSWRLFFWVLMFCGLWMLGLPAFLGSFIASITAIIFVIGVLYFIKNDILSFKFPSEKTLDKALEKQSDFPKGTIAILDDELANPQKHKTRDLWSYAQKEILISLKLLKTPHTRAVLSRADPSAIRFFAILIFISGLMISGGQWQNKILNGMFPFSPSNIIAQGKTTNLWIKPPEYTQIKQTHIIGNANPNGETLDIAEGSKIRVRMHSRFGEFLPPNLHIGEKSIPLTYLGDKLYGIETIIENGNKLYITQAFIPRAHWDYNFIKDTPPEISVKQPPYEIMKNSQIRFSLIVKDDYGVKDLHMSMKIDEMVEDRPLGTPIKQVRLIMSQPDTEFKISPVYDMTWHTWAGLPVTFEYIATDHKGQSAILEKTALTLPERAFEHPMAKTLIALRKRLAWNYDDSFIDISRNLEILLSAPDYFQNNLTVYLALRSASSRLFYSELYQGEKRINSVKDVIDLLWNAALVIEDGNLSLAMRELSDAQSELENAMRDPETKDSEIAALMDNLREKMANYFAEMQREMQKNMADGESFPPLSAEDFGQIISPDVLSKLLEQIESALKSGDAQKAQELMSQLQRMMEMIDPSMSPQLPMDMQAMREGVNELQELIENQQTLLDQTTTDKPPSKGEQEALRYILGQIMLDISEKLDEIPETMGMAEQEMRLSEKALGENKPFESIIPQEQAIKYLKDSQENLNKQFKSRMKQMVGIGFNATAQQLDPLGRPYEKQSNDVKLPDSAQRKRVDEILKMLRDRSGDRSRPDEELYYFRRLLRQF